ncbi:hypothetical protein HSACCH_01655 [Halanaerobium saccharolyticum subsp. saccharolyticum DSM 6643]|uniref:Uncharacterized protein n=1 Tax=Halanaerobium saccharolyticum subsp. saccharolyticum DSM 6643 TaxID=1293054 RepID=M5EFC3_9FIRM|nr:hypothetical protein [Halanaerobium saccharolyticum]CCU79850.1 hypothetical protein HSACCH_01655 [Halanaerobium saccharolyticum subsp. saccharolyticum DSM 6643]
MTAGCCGGNENKENNGGNNMMPDMAKKMMSNMQNKGFSPQEMCEKMTASVEKTAKLAGQANDEVQMLFEEWAEQVEKELLDLLKNIQEDKNDFDAGEAAESLKVSEDTVLFFLSRLIKNKKIEVTSLKLK